MPFSRQSRVTVESTQFEILKDHAPIISTLQKGTVEYGDQQLEILGGFVSVQKNEVSVCIEKAE